MNKSLQPKRKASATALILLVLVVLLIMGVGMLSLGLHSRMLALRVVTEIAARCAADAGLTRAVFEMNEKLKAKNWTDNPLPYTITEALPNCDATFSYSVGKDSDDSYIIESIGSYGRAKRKVNSIVRLKGVFEYAVFTEADIELKNGTTIDGYNFGAGDKLQVGTNSIAGAAVIMKTGVTINGDVVVGVDGNPDVVINSRSEAVITGETYALVEEHELSPVIVPAWLQSLPSQGTITTGTTITTSAKYDKIDLSSSEILVIDGAVTLYVIGDVILGNSAQLQIVDPNTNPDASLTLYLGGELLCQNGGFINNLPQDPTKLKIYGLDSCTQISFKTASDFYGAIYAPNADVRSHNSVQISGSVVANSFIQDVAANFYYDASLRDVSVNDVGVHFVVERWCEE